MATAQAMREQEKTVSVSLSYKEKLSTFRNLTLKIIHRNTLLL